MNSIQRAHIFNELAAKQPKQPQSPPEAEITNLNERNLWATKLDPNARYLIALNDNDYAISMEDVVTIKKAFSDEGIRVVVITGDPKVYELQAAS